MKSLVNSNNMLEKIELGMGYFVVRKQGCVQKFWVSIIGS